MKEYLIIIAILIIIFAGAIYTKNFLNKTTDKVLKELEELKTEISKTEEDRDDENIEKLAEKICNEWFETNHSLSVIVVHSELDSIQIALTRLKTKIIEGEINESLEELEVTKFLLENLAEKERFNLKNIF